MRHIRIVSRLGLAGILLFGAITASCNPCRFGWVRNAPIDGARGGAVGCCGAFVRLGVTVDDKQEYEIQLSSAEFPGKTTHVDAWVTDGNCDRLFDGPYPAAEDGTPSSPICRAIVGPVAPGSVGPRVKVSAGTYRVFIQSWSSNTESAPYQISLDLWGRVCSIVGYSPTY